MTDCKFKVGQVYKDRNGIEYKIIAVVPEALPQTQIIAMRPDGCITMRYITGRLHNNGLESHFDLLPNKRKEWVVTFEFHDDCTGKRTEQYRVWGEAQERAAHDFVESVKRMPLVFTRVRGPMLWEYEE